MNLARYRCNKPVRAARIEIVHPIERGLSITIRRLTVRDAGDQMAVIELRGNEITDEAPEPGDYYINDSGRKYVVPKKDFEIYYVAIPDPATSKLAASSSFSDIISGRSR